VGTWHRMGAVLESGIGGCHQGMGWAWDVANAAGRAVQYQSRGWRSFTCLPRDYARGWTSPSAALS
jgi:hypothetical protein